MEGYGLAPATEGRLFLGYTSNCCVNLSIHE